MNIKRKIFAVVAIFVVIFVVMVTGHLSMAATSSDTSVSTNTTMYLSLVNDGLGFYKVRNIETIPRKFTYDNHILNINIGDTLIWENDADISTLTIVSDQHLWNDQVGRIKVGQKINYKFDKPGTYTFRIKEASSMVQKIIVSNIGEVQTAVKTTTSTATYPTPVPAATYKPSYTVPAVKTPSSAIVRITAVPNTSKNTPISASTNAITNLEIPIKITPTSFASMAVGALSIYVTFRWKSRK